MIILNCHIENFGKLHDLSLDFTDKENIICEDNGWGKSTLSAFIRAMFYGLDGERKRSIEENERKRYTPWQGGAFGGSLTFEVQGKQYTVTRFFNEQDDFELRETKTNKISHDFSKNLGEELFKINRESFMRTVFVGQNDCTTLATDDINAKIGNLTENSNDLNSFEATNERLTKILNSMTPKRSTGSLSRRAGEITELNRKVTEGNGIDASLESYQNYLNEESKNYDSLKAQIQAIGEEQEKISKLQTVIAKVDAGKERVATYAMSESEKNELGKLETMFRDNLPDDSAISKMREEAQRLKLLRQQLLKEQMTPEERNQFRELESVFYDESETVTSVVEKWNIRNAKKAALPSNQAALAALKASMSISKPAEKKNMPGIFAGVSTAIIGGILAVMNMLIPGVVLIIAGIILLVIGLLVPQKTPAQTVQSNVTELEEMQKQIERDGEVIHKIELEVSEYLKKHGKTYDELMVSASLQEITREYITYTDLKKKNERAKQSNISEEADRISSVIRNYLTKFVTALEEERYVDALYEIKHKRDTYTMLKQKETQSANARMYYEEAKKELAEFEKENNIADATHLPSLAMLNETIMKLTDDMEKSRSAIDDYNRNLELLQSKHDEWEENKLRLEELQKMQIEETKKYEHITKAKLYLALAKEAITEKYAAPILESFTKYYTMITGQAEGKFHIDANTNITIEELGRQRETNTQSSGYKDLIGLCLRIAFIDAMYKDEKPVLVMDDPFVNLDDKKQEKAMSFLKHIAEKYQIIYFTCSNARTS